jgi:hypothetical protein
MIYDTFEIIKRCMRLVGLGLIRGVEHVISPELNLVCKCCVDNYEFLVDPDTGPNHERQD